MPIEPPPSPWDFPDPSAVRGELAGSDVIAVGADLEPGTLLAAYRAGLFPMRVEGALAWWSPDPRGVIPVNGMPLSRSLRRAIPRFGVTIDAAFTAVMRGCADPRRPHGWIDDSFIDAYSRLHELGWAHSVEVWQQGTLAGGLYGVRIERFFAGESMFHRISNASKVACWAALELLRSDGVTLFDVQWTTPHLRSLGAIDFPRDRYLRKLREAVSSRG